MTGIYEKNKSSQQESGPGHGLPVLDVHMMVRGCSAQQGWSEGRLGVAPACVCSCPLVCSLAHRLLPHKLIALTTETSLNEGQREWLHTWQGAEHMCICLCSLYSVSRDVIPAGTADPALYCMLQRIAA